MAARLPHQRSKHLIIHLLSIVNGHLSGLANLRVRHVLASLLSVDAVSRWRSLLTEEDYVIFLAVLVNDE